ncbi:hypothetical protein Tco_0620682 [Tanacetum coccineum]
MKDVFEATKSDLCETWKQNELLKDQLLEATLKHEIKFCVMLSHECVVNNMKDEIEKVVQIFLWIVDSGCSKHMTGDRSLLKNFIEKFMGTVRFGNDHFAAITGYGDYVQGNIMICHVYYVEGLGHNLFSVGQFYDGDLEVAFRSKTCYVRNLEGDDLLTGDRESNLYTIFIPDMAASSPVSLMSKASSTKSWLWHRRLSHLNFAQLYFCLITITMSRSSSSPVASKFAHAPSYYPYIIYSSEEEPFDDLKSEYEVRNHGTASPPRPSPTTVVPPPTHHDP